VSINCAYAETKKYVLILMHICMINRIQLAFASYNETHGKSLFPEYHAM
jgi:hypothetical protein